MPQQIQIRTNLRDFAKGLSDVQKKQLPFAIATALTATAGHVGQAWQQQIAHTFDKPTPFTLNSVGVWAARKSNLTAMVFIKDIAAAYLEPFIDGGVHFLGKKQGLLTPKNIGVNQYGNLPRNKLAALKARSDIYVGRIKTKSGGEVDGVWQRIKPSKGKPGHLKLLIRFTDPHPVRQRLDLSTPTLNAVRRYFDPAFTAAFAKAMASAR